ncbi:MAG: signal peptidase II [Gemmatimonadota bacterium]
MFVTRSALPVVPRSRAGRRRLILLVLLAVFVTDVASKSWAVAAAGTGIWSTGVLELALAENQGLAFSTGTGTLSGGHVLLIRLAVLSALVLVALRFALDRLRFALGFGLVLGGGLGNAWDGAAGDSAVVDFISTAPISRALGGDPLAGGVVLNLADLWIITGLALLYPLFRIAGRAAQGRFRTIEARVLSLDPDPVDARPGTSSERLADG